VLAYFYTCQNGQLRGIWTLFYRYSWLHLHTFLVILCTKTIVESLTYHSLYVVSTTCGSRAYADTDTGGTSQFAGRHNKDCSLFELPSCSFVCYSKKEWLRLRWFNIGVPSWLLELSHLSLYDHYSWLAAATQTTAQKPDIAPQAFTPGALPAATILI